MKIASNKIRDIIRFFRDELQEVYERDELETIISWCFEHYLKFSKTQLMLKMEETVSESELLKLNFAVKELKKHRPIQYVLGEADFMGMKLKVNEQVLIPRPETEELVQLILDENKDAANLRILDIGTGSGCIAIALAKKMQASAVFGMDISAGAIKLAAQNAEDQDVKVTFEENDILSKDVQLPAALDIIVSNPPYVTRSEGPQMRKNVLDHEPHLALFVENDDPLEFFRAICDHAIISLKNGGLLYFEINSALGPQTQQLLEQKGFKNVCLVKDLSNNYRILRGVFNA